jgi:uncharacterized cofD-like protein
VWPITTERATLCATYVGGERTRGGVEVDRGQLDGQRIERVHLDPPVTIHPTVARAIRELDAIMIGPGSFYTSLMPIFLVNGCRDAIQSVKGPVILIANLLTEGRGMAHFTAAEEARLITEAIGRPIDAVIWNNHAPSQEILEFYEAEHKAPMLLGDMPAETLVVEGAFWRGRFARHSRRRLRAAVWAALSRKCF